MRGKILDKDSRELRSGKTIIIFHITDFTDTITVKVFANEDTLEDSEWLRSSRERSSGSAA